MKLASVLVAVALGASLLAACGDDDDEETKKALTKPEYIAKGDQVCARFQKDFGALFRTDFPVTKSSVPEFFQKATPVVQRQVSGLRALEPPEADKAQIDKMLASGDKAVADFRKASTDAEYGAQVFNEEGGKNAQAFDKQAKAYGFKKCGEEEDDEDEQAAKVDPSTFSAEKKAYIKKADAVCAKANKEGSRIEQRYFKSFPPELGTWAKAIPAFVAASRPSIEEFEAIEPPAADKAKIEALTAKQKKLLDDFEDVGKLAKAKDEPGFQEQAPKVFSDSDDADAELRAYGFEECGAGDD